MRWVSLAGHAQTSSNLDRLRLSHRGMGRVEGPLLVSSYAAPAIELRLYSYCKKKANLAANGGHEIQQKWCA
eukprot:3333218-Rhodomonas_salina.2